MEGKIYSPVGKFAERAKQSRILLECRKITSKAIYKRHEVSQKCDLKKQRVGL